MRCPPEISEIILEIIRTGLLRIRSVAWSGNADLSAIEADHIHNLPDLIANFSPEVLVSYWSLDRTAYIARFTEEHHAGWEPLWKRLQPHIEHITTKTTTR